MREVDDEALRTRLLQLPSDARDDLRRVLIRDQPYRDEIAEQLLRRRTEGADHLAELIDMLTIDNDMRRQVVRVLGESGAAG